MVKGALSFLFSLVLKWSVHPEPRLLPYYFSNIISPLLPEVIIRALR